MVDRTKEDIIQDQRIARVEQDMRELRAKFESAAETTVSHGAKLAQHEDRLNFLNPLTALLEHVEQIIHFITNIRSIKR